jgi:hypothetical protein
VLHAQGSSAAEAGSPPRRAEAPRRLNHDVVASLEPFVGSPLLENGLINLLSLDAVITRLGARWPAKRQAVYDYTERTLERAIGDEGHYLRVSEADFLIVLPQERRHSAQVRCLRYLRMVLTHFLGKARPVDLVVREVTKIANTALEALRVDLTDITAAGDEEDAELGSGALEAPAPTAAPTLAAAPVATAQPASSPALTPIERQPPAPRAPAPVSPEAERPHAASVDRWSPFVAANGCRVRVSCVLEPVFELRTYGRIGYRIARRVISMGEEEVLSPAELRNLSRADIQRIDLATIARGLDRLRAEASGERQLSLIIPVSYISLSHRSGRAALADQLHEAKALVQAGVIVEVCDIEGVPQAALLEAIALIRPFCMFLIGRLNGAPDNGLGNLQNTGLSGVSFDAPRVMSGDAEFMGWTRAAVQAAKRVAKSVIIYHLGSARQAGMAALLGASHASLQTGAQGAVA